MSRTSNLVERRLTESHPESSPEAVPLAADFGGLGSSAYLDALAARMLAGPLPPEGAPELQQLSMEQRWELMGRLGQAEETTADTLELLVDGEEIRPALLEVMNGAETSLHSETFTYADSDDEYAVMHTDAMIAASDRLRASGRGPARAVYDAVGAGELGPLHNGEIQRMLEAGVDLHLYNPIDNVNDLSFHRDHRKGTIADRGVVGRAVAIVKSANIKNRHIGNANVPRRWHDFAFKVTGPAVDKIDDAFRDSYREASGHDVPEGERRTTRSAMAPHEGIPLRVLAHAQGDRNILAVQIAMLEFATPEHPVYMENSFPMLPELAAAVSRALARGVPVHWVVDERKGILGDLQADDYPALLAAGADIAQYATPTHIKGMSWGPFSMGGTSNGDAASQRNREIMLLSFNWNFARDFVARVVGRDLERNHLGQRTVHLPKDLRYPLWRRLRMKFANAVYPDSFE